MHTFKLGSPSRRTTHSTLFLPATLICISLFAGCNKQENTPSVTSPVAAVPPQQPGQSPVANSQPSTEIPEVIRGTEFALGGKCTVDTVNGKRALNQMIEVSAKDGIAISGWALDDVKKLVPSTVVFQLAGPTGKYHVVGDRITKRPDLVTQFGVAGYIDSGYDVHFSTTGIPLGTYDVLVIMKGDNKNLVCNTFRSLKLTG